MHLGLDSDSDAPHGMTSSQPGSHQQKGSHDASSSASCRTTNTPQDRQLAVDDSGSGQRVGCELTVGRAAPLL